MRIVKKTYDEILHTIHNEYEAENLLIQTILLTTSS